MMMTEIREVAVEKKRQDSKCILVTELIGLGDRMDTGRRES